MISTTGLLEATLIDQLAILRRGAAEWNGWRLTHPEVGIDLHETSVHSNYDLHGVNLSGGYLHNADFEGVDLTGASFVNATLTGVPFRGVDLKNANLSGAEIGDSIFANVAGLCDAIGLESVTHFSPSTVGIDTLTRALGRVPDSFLRGCGLSDWQVVAAKLYNPSLTAREVSDLQYEIFSLHASRPIQTSSVFISYSRRDGPFVDALQRRLDEDGVRSWRDVHDLKAGRLEVQLDRAIRLNPTVLLVLSQQSVESDWVEWEVRKARELEKELSRDVLCPIALDDSWSKARWPGPLRLQIEDYNILDFSAWRRSESFTHQYERLIEGLSVFYRPRSSRDG